MRCILDKDDINCDSHNTAVAYSKATLSIIKLRERCKIKKIKNINTNTNTNTKTKK